MDVCLSVKPHGIRVWKAYMPGYHLDSLAAQNTIFFFPVQPYVIFMQDTPAQVQTCFISIKQYIHPIFPSS